MRKANESRGPMKHRKDASARSGAASDGAKPGAGARRAESHGHKRFRSWMVIVLIVALVGCAARAMLPWLVRHYVNRALDRSPLYSGDIGKVRLHLWRGAYSIYDIQLSKTTGAVPVPFFAAKRVDFALQWNALLHHRIVGKIVMEEPQLNFVDAPSESESQTGAGGAWLQMIQDLFPFTINSAILRDGSVHFRTYQSKQPVDVYLSELNGSIDDLGNVRGDTTPLVATAQATALAMGQASLQFKMALDPFSYRPTFHLALRLLGLDVTKINDLALSYGKFDFKRGWFDLVVEADAQEGQLTGYVKPLFRDLKVFSLVPDIKEDNVLQFFWQALVGVTTKVFKNQARNQFGTLIPFMADAGGSTSTDILATIGNVLRNAFVRAYLPQLENGLEPGQNFHFEPADFKDSISANSLP